MGRMLVGMIAALVWYSVIYIQLNMINTNAFGAIGEISTLEKEGWLRMDKSDDRP